VNGSCFWLSFLALNVEEAGWVLHPSKRKGAYFACTASRSLTELERTSDGPPCGCRKHWRLTRGSRRTRVRTKLSQRLDHSQTQTKNTRSPQRPFPGLSPSFAGFGFQATVAIGSSWTPSRVACGIRCCFGNFSAAKYAFHWVLQTLSWGSHVFELSGQRRK
jgi:hypothetical protein